MCRSFRDRSRPRRRARPRRGRGVPRPVGRQHLGARPGGAARRRRPARYWGVTLPDPRGLRLAGPAAGAGAGDPRRRPGAPTWRATARPTRRRSGLGAGERRLVGAVLVGRRRCGRDGDAAGRGGRGARRAVLRPVRARSRRWPRASRIPDGPPRPRARSRSVGRPTTGASPSRSATRGRPDPRDFTHHGRW